MDTNAAFVSYSRKDLAFVQKLVKDLKAGGASVWLDKSDIAAGTEWDRAVQNALTSCQQMLLVLSPTSAASDNVLDEITVAIRTRKTILPILYQDCEVPIRVSRLQYIDFRGDYSEAIEDLLRQLKSHQAGLSHAQASGPAVSSEPPTPHAVVPVPGKRKSRRWVWVTVPAAVMIIWAVVYFSGLGSHAKQKPDPQVADATATAGDAPSAAKPPDNPNAEVDLKLRALLGASGDDAKAYLGPPDQWTRDGNKVTTYYWKRSLTLELDSPNGHVDSICFYQAGQGFSGNSGAPVAHVLPGMTKPEIQSVLHLPTSGGQGYSFFNSSELSGQTLSVDWKTGEAGADPVAQRVCINQD